MKNVGKMRIADAVRYGSSIRIEPQNYNNQQELFDAVREHAKRWQRYSDSTIKCIFRCATSMSRHPIFPIDFGNLSYEQFIAHMRYREEIEKAGRWALKRSLQAIRVFLKAYGMDDKTWFYKLPPTGKTQKRIIPLPAIVYKLINYKYSNDRYENALYQYMLAHSFWIGWRVPSEMAGMKTDDVDLENNCLYIKETKKYNSIRQIYPDEAILYGKTRKSFKNWIDYWRPKVENQYSKDFLYLQPSGKPFTKDYLRKRLSKNAKRAWIHYQPYISRHWNAIGMLIRTKLECGSFDIYTVRNWLGHEKIETTLEYVRYAEQFYRIAQYDWIKATLKFYNDGIGSFYETTANKNGFGQILSLWQRRTRRDSNPVTGEKLIKISPIFEGFGLIASASNPLFFFFCFGHGNEVSSPSLLLFCFCIIPCLYFGGGFLWVCPNCKRKRVRHRLGSGKAYCRNCRIYFFGKVVRKTAISKDI